MTTTVYDLNRFKFKPDEKLLIDVNVLIYLQTGTTKKYDQMWELASRQNNELYITTLSISEFINRHIRSGYSQYCREHNKSENTFNFKKNYQSTDHFIALYNDVIDTVETEIIPKMTVLDFKNDDLINISDLTKYMFDINDALYLRIAKKNGFAIVTHDSDFFNIPIPEEVKVYTYNKK